MHLTQCHSGLCWLFHPHCWVSRWLWKSSPECLVLLIYLANISPELTEGKLVHLCLTYKSSSIKKTKTVVWQKLNYRKCWHQSWCMLDPTTDKNLNASTSTHLELLVWRKRGKSLCPLFVWLSEKSWEIHFLTTIQRSRGQNDSLESLTSDLPAQWFLDLWTANRSFDWKPLMVPQSSPARPQTHWDSPSRTPKGDGKVAYV